MKPTVAVTIVDRDKTGPGQKSAEARFGKFVKRTEGFAKDSGVAKLGKMLGGLTRFNSVGFGASGLMAIGQAAGAARTNVAGLAAQSLSMGEAGKAGFGMVEEAAATAAGTVAGVVTAVVGLGAAAYMLGDKWAKTGAEVDRTSKSLSTSTAFLQRARAENERFGVSAEQTTASVDALGTTLYDAKYGANNLALGAMNQLGVKLKTNKDGVTDLEAAYYDLSDAIARQKDPMVQRKLAAIFGLSAALPAMRQGSGKLKAEGADYQGSGAALTDAQVAEAAAVNRKTIALKQHLSAIEKTAGVAAMGVTGLGAEAALHPSSAITAITGGARELAHSGLEAGRHLVDGGRQAAHDIADAVRSAQREAGDKASVATAFFRHLGYTPEQARGMTAGAYAESQLRPNGVNPTSGAFGIGQWLGSRKKELLRRYGDHPTFGQQLEFMGWELTHTEASAGHAIREAQSPTDAMDAYVRRFMRPAAGPETTGDLRRGGNFLEGRQATGGAKTQVEITLRGAPAGTSARVTPAPGADVGLRVAHGMDGL